MSHGSWLPRGLLAIKVRCVLICLEDHRQAQRTLKNSGEAGKGVFVSCRYQMHLFQADTARPMRHHQ